MEHRRGSSGQSHRVAGEIKLKRVYLVNLSFGLAGIERRFANLWRVLYERGRVFPILVVPASLASALAKAGLLPADPSALIIVREPRLSMWIDRLHLPPTLKTAAAIIRSRLVARRFRDVWKRITRESDVVLHVGLNTSALRPPDVPAVYECVDATLQQLGNGHYKRASKLRCIVHCQTDRIRNALDRTFHGRAPKWHTMTNPTYFADYGGDSGESADRDPGLIAFVGRLSVEKNPLLFLEAVAEIVRGGTDCRVVMLGAGPMRAECEAFIEAHGLAGSVTVDFVSRPIEVLRRAAVYVSLQTGDNYGSQSLLEAMGAGCAIVASDVGETSRIVADEVGARVPLVVEAVAAAMARLIASPEHTRRLGRRAAQIAKSQYSADTYASFLEGVYEFAGRYHRGAGVRQPHFLSTDADR